MNLEEMVICNEMVALVDKHSENGVLTSSHNFDEQVYMNHLLWNASLKGFSLLGSGFFSGAFSHKDLPGRVIKVGLKKEDSGAAYAAWCRANQHLEGVPVIHHISRHASCYIVVLDRLEPFCQHVNTNGYGDYEWVEQNDAQQSIIDAYDAAKRGIYGAGNVHEEHSALYNTCRAIWEFFSGIASFDLHDENVMVDPKTKKLVITDPVSFVQEGLNGFDVDLGITEGNKKKVKRAAAARLRDSTWLHAKAFVGASAVRKACKGQGVGTQLNIWKGIVINNRNNLAVDMARQVTIDLDKRLNKQFLRG